MSVKPGTERLLRSFDELNGTRGYGVSGPLAVTYAEIGAYAALTGQHLSAWDVGTLVAMDGGYMAESYSLRDKS